MGIPEYNAETRFAALAETLSDQGIDVEEIKIKLKAQEIETPSWGLRQFGDAVRCF